MRLEEVALSKRGYLEAYAGEGTGPRRGVVDLALVRTRNSFGLVDALLFVDPGIPDLHIAVATSTCGARRNASGQ